MDFEERIKIFKLMWDAIGSEFGGRHELYEINYTGSQDLFFFFKQKKSAHFLTLKRALFSLIMYLAICN